MDVRIKCKVCGVIYYASTSKDDPHNKNIMLQLCPTHLKERDDATTTRQKEHR